MLLSELIAALEPVEPGPAFAGSLHAGFPSSEACWEAAIANPLHQESFMRLQEKAADFRSIPAGSLPFSAFRLFDSTGNRIFYEQSYFSHRGRLNTFALLALSGDETALPHLEDAIWAVCDEYTWCLPAHLGGRSLDPSCVAGSGRSASDRTSIHPHDQEVDLFASETAFALSEICALLEDRLSPIVTARARLLIRERVLKPVMDLCPAWGWESVSNNWAAVCAGSVGIAAMYLIHDSATLAPVLIRMIQAMDSFLSGFEADGACTEGLGYWNYGFGFFVTFAERLYARTGGCVDLMAGEKIRQISLFQQRAWLGGDCVLSFSDGGRFGRWHPGLTHWLRRRLPEVKAPDTRYIHRFGDDTCHRWNWDLRNFIWADPQDMGAASEPGIPVCVAPPAKRDLFAVKTGVRAKPDHSSGLNNPAGPNPSTGPNNPTEAENHQEAAADKGGSVWFADAAWLVSKTAWEGGTVVFAAKGGHNDEPHNHNDLGSFLLHAEGETFLDDAGSGEYTKGYFGPERYDFLVNGSFGHSVPFFGQIGQSAGKRFMADVILAETGADADVLALDLARAYDLPALRSFTRTFQWEKGAAPCLILEDHIVMEDAGLSVTERFVSFLKPIPEGNGVLLRGKNAAVRISTETPGFNLSISKETFSNHEGEPEILWKADFTHISPEPEIRFRAEFRFHKG